jgi:hypothetical protein
MTITLGISGSFPCERCYAAGAGHAASGIKRMCRQTKMAIQAMINAPNTPGPDGPTASIRNLLVYVLHRKIMYLPCNK